MSSKFKDLKYDTSGRVRVIYNTQVVELIKDIKSLPAAEYGNKREVADVLAAGVRNGRDPEIRQAQKNLAARAKANSHESHKYSSSWGYSRRFMRNILR